ncbi:membrane-associated protein, putative [Bodo saltans]|uniref:Membrane-associated protein, putative n=1 Tax=Bodo saltans TaxID=75058 RepID=A0A0S4IZW3_BODSA|nr:membrane-associated protein, putative [Bodo saltans]|eukprot:CUG05490.1 membrane-associated protein, putative [Bodo saltans]
MRDSTPSPSILVSCFVGLTIILYVLWSERSTTAPKKLHAEALDVAIAKYASGADHSGKSLAPLSDRAKRFLTSRWVSSSSWSSPSSHHLPNLRRMLQSALDAPDLTSQKVQESLRNQMSVGEHGEPRIAASTMRLRYKLDVSIFIRPEHRRRLQLWSMRHRTTKDLNIAGEMNTGLDTLTSAVVVFKELPWNAAQSLAICELVPLLSNKMHMCSENTRSMVQQFHRAWLQSISSQSTQTSNRAAPSVIDASVIEPLMKKYFITQQLAERFVLAGATSRQNFLAVFNDGAHFAASPIGLSQQLCDGSRSGRELDLEDVKTQTMVSRAVWNQHLMDVHGEELMSLRSELTESTSSVRAEELLLGKVKIWDPVRVQSEMDAAAADNAAAQSVIHADDGHITPREAESMEVLFRPTLLCVVMTTFGDGLKLAMLQFILWGDQCDDFAIVVASANSQGQEKLQKAFPDLQRISRIRPDRLIHVRMTSDDVKRNLWHQFQLTLVALDDWPSVDTSFQYFYFATEDTFMVPENMYDMLMQQEFFTLHAANTPLLLGNVMFEPAEKVAYASSGPGIVLNNVAFRVAMALTPNDACRAKLVSNAWDVLLAKCLSTVGIVAKDTTDELGEDRFHVLSLHWMLLAPTLTPQRDDGAEKWWYDEQRPRDDRAAKMDNPFRALSSATIAFNKINTPEKALWMHMQLRHG